MVEVLKFPFPEKLAEGVAAALLAEMNRFHCAAVSGARFGVALSGGRIAGHLFSALARAPGAGRLLAADYFWADERCVSPNSADSNYKLARDRLFLPLGVPKQKVHRIRGEVAPAEAAIQAESELRACAASGSEAQPVLDLVLLGMGEDGHVASLFPGEPEHVRDDPAVFRPVNSPKPPSLRITMGYATIAAARQVWVLISGHGKEPALRAALRSAGSLPLARVLHSRPETRIFTDVTVTS
jgi:6-phosphogluconolactonase